MRATTQMLQVHMKGDTKAADESHARQARVVELRSLGRLTVAETADVLGSNEQTAKTDWRFARAWLNRRLREEE